MRKQVRVWFPGNGANLWRKERAGYGPLLSLVVKFGVEERGPRLPTQLGSTLLPYKS